MKSSTSVVVSANECAASDNMAAEVLSRPATNFAKAMATLTRPAMITVRTLCDDASDSVMRSGYEVDHRPGDKRIVTVAGSGLSIPHSSPKAYA